MSPPLWRAPLDPASCAATLAAVDPRVRLGTAADARAVTALLRELAAAEWGGIPADMGRHLAAWLADPAPGFCLVAEEAGQVVGACIVQRMPAPAEGGVQLFIDDIYVARTCRRRGLGRAMVAGTRALGDLLGAVYLYLQVRPGNGPARALYEAMGLEDAQVVVYEQYREG